MKKNPEAFACRNMQFVVVVVVKDFFFFFSKFSFE